MNKILYTNKYQIPSMVNFRYKQPNQYIRRDINPYAQYKHPVKQYQSTYDASSMSSAANGPEWSGGNGSFESGYTGEGMSTGDLAGYAGLANVALDAFSDPTKGINRNPNANLQEMGYTPTDAPISTLAEDAPIALSQNFKGGNRSTDVMSAAEIQNVRDGIMQGAPGTGDHLMAGASGAMTGLAAGGPVGALVGFAIGTVGSMMKTGKYDDAATEAAGALSAQNAQAKNMSAANISKANDAELSRFLV